MVEEAYEVIDAIDRADDPHLREELGDFLLQVFMHSQIAEERGAFDLDAVANEICEKLVRRHPHVFGGNELGDSDAVLRQWEEIKRGEKGARPESVLDGVAASLPALMRAEKIQKKAARVGFDWPDLRGVLEKIREETVEVEEALAAGDRAGLEREIGDLLFSVVNLSRKCKFDAELALQQATNKFAARFRRLEDELAAVGKKFHEMTLADLDAIWDSVKKQARP
jgi:MazG family protein